MIKKNYNPDVLSCLANLSNDEVFTPPSLVNQILDLLPEELWHDKNATFLDPVTKTGVFLREITARLIEGLKDQIPDQQERLNHILQNQVFGIAITELTSLIARRSLYCSKKANGKYSISDVFENEKGNIIFDKIEHAWQNGSCSFCGASKEVYSRSVDLEAHAYQFIHTNHPENIYNNMKFDVVIGNPPYQLSDGGAQESATPIYNKFIDQAKKLNPKYLTMIIPARWYSGGKGLNQFRETMLRDTRMAEIHDFPDTSDCFPGLNIRGGICYFLWDKQYKGDCKIITHKNGNIGKPVVRPLLEKGVDIFIRYNEAVPIFHKVRKLNEESFSTIVSSRKPFGLATNFDKFSLKKKNADDLFLYKFRENGYVDSKFIVKNSSWVNKYKVFVPYASPGDDSYPHLILSKPIIGKPGTVCTETYLVIGPFTNEVEANNVSEYMKTKFFRFMILLMKSAQHITQETYKFVPIQKFDQIWTDEKLISKYKLDSKDVEFINSMIKPIN